MKCDELLDVIYGYTDGELSPRENEQIRTHLRECSLCASRVKEQEILIGKFRDSLRAGVKTPDLADSVMSRLGQPTLRVVRRRAMRWVWSAVACAAVVVIAIIGMLLISKERTKQQPIMPAVAEKRQHGGAGHVADRPGAPDRVVGDSKERAKRQWAMPVVAEKRQRRGIGHVADRPSVPDHVSSMSKLPAKRQPAHLAPAGEAVGSNKTRMMARSGRKPHKAHPETPKKRPDESTGTR